MCYAIPGKIIEIKDKIAVVDYFGEHRRALNELRDIKIGDYAYAQGGILIKRIPAAEAIPILKDWQEMFFKLKKVDLSFSKTKQRVRVERKFRGILERAEQCLELRKEETLRLLKTDNKKEINLLFQVANKIRQKKLKNSCCVHGIIEFSNYCKNNCFYCGIRRDNKNLKRYRMGVKEIVRIAENAVNRSASKRWFCNQGKIFGIRLKNW